MKEIMKVNMTHIAKPIISLAHLEAAIDIFENSQKEPTPGPVFVKMNKDAMALLATALGTQMAAFLAVHCDSEFDEDVLSTTVELIEEQVKQQLKHLSATKTPADNVEKRDESPE